MSTRAEEFTALYKAEHDRLAQQVFRRVGCRGTADDLVHNIFLRIWERTAGTLMEPAAYLTRSARNAAIDHLRAERRRSEFVAGILPEQYAPPVSSPEETFSAREELRGVEEALAVLPDRTRHIFLLNRVYGKTFSEIAVALGLSKRSVTKHMARAMAACEDAR